MVTSSWSPDLVVGNIFEKILGKVDNIGKDIKYLGWIYFEKTVINFSTRQIPQIVPCQKIGQGNEETMC